MELSSVVRSEIQAAIGYIVFIWLIELIKLIGLIGLIAPVKFASLVFCQKFNGVKVDWRVP